MGFFSDDNKYISKEDGLKIKEERYNGSARYLKIIEDEKDSEKHETVFAYRTADGAYTEGYHGANVSTDDKESLGKDFDSAVDNGPHYFGK